METQVQYDGNVYNIHYHNDLIRRLAVERNTFFEDWLLTPLKEKVTSFDFIIDIGANVGNHSLFFKQVCGAKKLVCFEPAPANFELLKLNCPDSELYNLALSSQETSGFIEMRDGIDNNSGTAALSTQGIAIILKTLDSFNFEKVTFIKIDVEGHEIEVIKGGLKTINKYKPDILVEIHNGVSIEDISNLLPGYSWEKISHESHYLFKYEFTNRGN